MTDMSVLAVAFLPTVAALVAFLDQSFRPKLSPRCAEAFVCAAFLSAVLLTVHNWGPATQVNLSVLSFRLDAVSLVMLALVTFIGWMIVRYSRVYLDGERRQGFFTAWLCLTLTCVILLVSAATLVQLMFAWIATSLSFQRLLLFYGERAGAQRAAYKKFIVARLSDFMLLAAVLLLGAAYDTQEIGTILAEARSGGGGSLAAIGAAFLALAAGFKSAQFPTHGWLTEVMEAPTPVSALLHAGLINAGGFLLIRFADVLLLAPLVLATLVLVGGFTAILASLVMLTQPAVKTSLAWSTIAQMGFMIFECGLGLFALALLHVVAHSLYKAHSFLASGGAVERVLSIRRPGPVAIPGPGAVARAFLVALAMYAVVGLFFDIAHKPPQAIALGAILIFGAAYLLAQGLADAAPFALTWRTSAYALTVSLSYFAFQVIATYLTTPLLPPPPRPGALEWALTAFAVFSFGLIAVAQTMFPLWAFHPAAAGLRVHLANGFYANAIFDRLIGAWAVRLHS
jgi:NAD(P)H-quinone oxidoreductase subunit 5